MLGSWRWNAQASQLSPDYVALYLSPKKIMIRLIHSSYCHLENMSIICLMGISLQSMQRDRDQQEMAGLWLIQLQKNERSVF